MCEAHPGLRVSQWHQQRHQYSHTEVDEQSVGCGGSRAPAQLARHHHGGCCGGADEAQQGTLDDGTERSEGEEDQHEAQQRKHAGLQQQVPQLPAAQVHLRRIDPAEGEEEHQKDEHRLHHTYSLQQPSAHAASQRQPRQNEIRAGTRHHAYGQGPATDKLTHGRLS